MAIITMSREMGTGAYQIAKDVAKKLKYMLVDGAKIAEVAPKYGLTPEIVDRVDEKPPSYITAEDRLQAARLKAVELILLEKAKKGNVILYGRGGQDLLKEMRNILRIRFIAPFDERVEMFAEREWIDPDLASDLIRKSDHQRGGFLHFYFNRDWHDPLGYDLIFNTSRLSHASIVESIVAAAKDPRFKATEGEAMDLLEDIILSKRVEMELLKSDKVQNLHFKITSQDGMIALTGHVHDEAEKSQVIRIAGKIKGVQKVVDNLQVMGFKAYKE
ncbi:cytidylate kinase family protein [Geomobilimonas luticola]|uniref:Cytidylate kinase family protein n=1 Tax=Geomobilimonas luticola TaxID=1114878 RepID=A0ABS5SFB7_9BACT|nr:cytidylate kinase family protein [Geomobilimonas luticola]MBT0654051.1 cytidylate kinase family protein [Geomobilimonas luticola]